MPAFRSVVEIQRYMESACKRAVETACNRLLGKLQEIIDEEYYDVFEPDFYNRTYQFWRSATTKMLNNMTGQIFMNPDAMHYNTGWNGEKQIITAAEGLHGGWDVGTGDHRYWDKFIEYCENNATTILKEELKRQGVPVK